MKNHTRIIFFIGTIVVIAICCFACKEMLNSKLKQDKNSINNNLVKSTTTNLNIREKNLDIDSNKKAYVNHLDKQKVKSIDEKIYVEKSVEKRDIKIYILGKDCNKNKIAILGSMHGDEPQGKYIVKQLIKYIKDNAKIIENTQILFIPEVNPDGLYKNMRKNAHEVDINRNFPTKNWKVNNESSRYYSGNKAASEPETNILINYINNFKPKLIINIHSPLKVVNYDGVNSGKIAEVMAKHNKYNTVGDIGYPTPGSFGTYFGKERNISVITLETSPDDEYIAWQENKESILAAIKYLNKNN